MSNVGLIGAGVMGTAAAKKILEAGHTLWVFDASQLARDKARELGAETTTQLKEMAEKAEIIIMFLPGPEEVEHCVNAPDGVLNGARPGLVIVDMSTVDPGVSRRMAKAARSKGVGYLDAPVLGRPAAVGAWALPVGGEAEDLHRCRPLLELIASKIFHIGKSGMGNQVKLLNQMMFGAINAMTAEMMAIAEKMGIPPRLVYETLTASQAGTVSNLFKELGARIASDNYGDPTFTVDLLIKDVHLAVEMARESGAPPLLSRTIEFINEMARAQGQGNMDTASMWKSFLAIWANGEKNCT